MEKGSEEVKATGIRHLDVTGVLVIVEASKVVTQGYCVRGNEDRGLYCKMMARTIGGWVTDQLKPAPCSLAPPESPFLCIYRGIYLTYVWWLSLTIVLAVPGIWSAGLPASTAAALGVTVSF